MLLNSTLEQYLLDLEQLLHYLEDAYIELFEEEIVTNERLNLRLRIRMGNNFLLEVNEAVIAEENAIQHLGYRYHFQDGLNNLIFRYDNTPHFPKLNGFPNHKHLPKGVIEAEKPDISNVIQEASSFQKYSP